MPVSSIIPGFCIIFTSRLKNFFGQELEVGYPVLIDKHRIGLPTVHLETDFSRPLRYGDLIEVEVRALNFGKTSITFGYRVFKKGESEPWIEGHNVTVCLDRDTFKKRDIPD